MEQFEGGKKLQVGIIFMLVLFAVLGLFLLTSDEKNYPAIHGKFIPEGRHIDTFELRNQFDQAYTNQDLFGKWHLVSYGYTSCPDICPTTLHVLTRFKKQLDSVRPQNDLTILFYSIDHQRDTVEILYQYMPFFHPDFIGLTFQESNRGRAIGLEQSLGMKSVLTPIPQADQNEFSGEYAVAHGVMLYLINPQGQLQAVLKPFEGRDGIQYFTQEQILKDYMAVRDYFRSQITS